MEWGVLGPVEVRRDGVAVAVGGSRERLVLARLLISANQVVATETLIDNLWEGEPPDGAAQALWVYVSRLRKALRGPGGDDVLVTRPPGYLLAVDPESLDAARFEELAAGARRLAADGDAPGAAALFRQALGLWRGPALGDVASMAFARAEAARLEEARLGVLEERITADLAAGADGALIGELAGLTGDHPLRERLWALRMTALYRAGRQAEALRAYQELRRHLGEELGIEPSEELRALEGSILRQDASLSRPPRAAQPATEPARLGAAVTGPTGTDPTAPDHEVTGPAVTGSAWTDPAWNDPAAPDRGVSDPVLPDPALTGVVTFMFTDLVGSTELLDRLGDVAADEVRRRHFASLRRALAANGGAEVKSLGDGLMAAFASPVAALRCAVEIQRAAAGDADQAGAVRVGIHAGEPIAEDDDFFGTPVVVAQRLCGRARGGQILCSSLVSGLAGNRAGCGFTTLGGLSLKGFAEPVAACEVVWAAPEPAPALPLPPPLERPEALAFVGRHGEMAALEAAWEAARGGERRLVLLAGEPGIGKTRLVAELARGAHAAGAVVFFGRCDEGMGVPYQPFVEALTTYLAQAATPALGPLPGELSRLVPEIRDRVDNLPAPAGLDPDTDRYRLFQAVTGWLGAVAKESPVVLVVDDCHWATPPTLALLNHVSRGSETMPVLIAVTYRDTELDVTPELSDALAVLLRHPGVERLRVAGLDEAGVAAFMEASAHQALDDQGRAFLPTLVRETGGNPFFVGQVLHHITETGAVERRDGRWVTTDVGLPEGLADVITRRLARLPGETTAVLAQAAVLGETFDLDVLVHAAGGDEIPVVGALDPAVAARLVAEPGEPGAGYRFVHALVRATVYDTLPSARRLDLHGKAGRAIEAVHAGRLDDHLSALALHFGRSGSADRVGAVEYATRAGDRAASSLAYGDAARWYRQALDLLDARSQADLARRCDLLIALGAAQRLSLDGDYAEPLAEAVRVADELGDAERLARAALAHSRGAFSETFVADRARIALYRRALDALGPSDSLPRARLLAALADALVWDFDQSAYELAGEALEVAHRLADPLVLGQVSLILWPLLTVFSVAFPLSDRWKDELVRLARQAEDPQAQYALMFSAAMMASAVGGLEEAEGLISECSRLEPEDQPPMLRWLAQMLRMKQNAQAGRLDEAEALAREAFEFGSAAGVRDAYPTLMGTLFWIRHEQGRLAEVIDVYLRGGRGAGAHPFSRAQLCLALCQLDRREEARPLFEGLVDSLEGRAVPLLTFGFLAEAAVTLADRERAARLHGWLAPHERFPLAMAAYSAGPVSHYLGILDAVRGDTAAAAGRFEAALALAEQMKAPTCAARTRLAWATMLARRARPGDATQARDLATAALATAEELGLSRIAADARALLAAPPPATQ